jgi:hypothetical protein
LPRRDQLKEARVTPALETAQELRDRDGANERRRAAGGQPVIAGGENLNFAKGERGGLGQHGSWRDYYGEPNQQRVLPQLSYQAGMGRTVGILVQPTMKLGGNGERECAEPEDKHEANDRKSAGATLSS